MRATIRHPAAALSLAAALALAACGTPSADGPTTGAMIRQAAGQIASGTLRRGSEAPAEAPSPEAMAAEALRVNPAPLILAGLEGAGTTQVLAMVGENAGMRTYMTENSQALILRGGMLVGTRGLGHDLSVAEAGTEALIRGRRAGNARRIMRLYTGDGLETPLGFDCTVQPEGQAMVEDCRAGSLAIQNRYLVSAGGAIPVSRQWISPGLGYVTIQTIRP